MIKSFVHKGLEKFFLKGSKAGIQAKHAEKLSLLLTRLNAASLVEQMDLPELDLHKLKGKLQNHWAIKVSGGWRLIFKFENGNAYVVDYLNYH
jgi:proteic killer suppression protein